MSQAIFTVYLHQPSETRENSNGLAAQINLRRASFADIRFAGLEPAKGIDAGGKECFIQPNFRFGGT